MLLLGVVADGISSLSISINISLSAAGIVNASTVTLTKIVLAGSLGVPTSLNSTLVTKGSTFQPPPEESFTIVVTPLDIVFVTLPPIVKSLADKGKPEESPLESIGCINS